MYTEQWASSQNAVICDHSCQFAASCRVNEATMFNEFRPVTHELTRARALELCVLPYSSSSSSSLGGSLSPEELPLISLIVSYASMIH